jgi:hypothetical protein
MIKGLRLLIKCLQASLCEAFSIESKIILLITYLHSVIKTI